MTDESMTAALAERVMGWGVRPDRFVMDNRGWMPRWRFQPTEKIVDAFWLLEQAGPQEYMIQVDDKGDCRVHVRFGERTGYADSPSKARAISMAIARAVGIEIDPGEIRRGDAR
jgi:hypothetical protein